jgi:hypothetical protein
MKVKIHDCEDVDYFEIELQKMAQQTVLVRVRCITFLVKS